MFKKIRFHHFFTLRFGPKQVVFSIDYCPSTIETTTSPSQPRLVANIRKARNVTNINEHIWI